MLKQPFSIIGKVSKGRVSVIVASPNKVVGHIRPLNKTKEVEAMNIDTTNLIPVRHTPAIKPVDKVDLPTFMKERTQNMQKAKQPKKESTFKQVLKSFM